MKTLEPLLTDRMIFECLPDRRRDTHKLVLMAGGAPTGPALTLVAADRAPRPEVTYVLGSGIRPERNGVLRVVRTKRSDDKGRPMRVLVNDGRHLADVTVASRLTGERLSVDLRGPGGAYGVASGVRRLTEPWTFEDGSGVSASLTPTAGAAKPTFTRTFDLSAVPQAHRPTWYAAAICALLEYAVPLATQPAADGGRSRGGGFWSALFDAIPG